MIIGIFIDSISQAFTQLIVHLDGDYERPIYVDLKDNYETTTTKKINVKTIDRLDFHSFKMQHKDVCYLRSHINHMNPTCRKRQKYTRAQLHTTKARACHAQVRCVFAVISRRVARVTSIEELLLPVSPVIKVRE